MARSRAPDPDLLDFSDAEMPDIDNGSDRESLFTENLADEDSPVDGYFEQREHPQANFVQQSSVQAEAESKAREAARERMAAASVAATQSSIPRLSTPQHSSSSPSTSSSSVNRPGGNTSHWEDESVPAVDPNPPPPDYETAISDRSSERNSNRVTSPIIPQSPRRPTDYGTVNHQTDSGHGEEDQNEAPWPFGNRGNPFAGGNFVFGNRGGPFGFRGNPFGFQGMPIFGGGRDYSHSNNEFDATRQQQHQPPPPPPPAVGPSFYPMLFSQDHPLVRNGLFGGQRGSGYRGQPESMADSSSLHSYQNDSDEESGLMRHRRRSRDDHRQRSGEWRRSASRKFRDGSRSAYRSCRRWISWIAVLAIVLLVVLICRGVYTATRDAKSGSSGDSGSSNEGNDDNNNNTNYNFPWKNDWPINPPVEPDTGGFNDCRWGIVGSAAMPIADANKFSFLEMFEERLDGPRRVWGEVRIRPAPKDQEDDIVVVMSVRTSDEWEIPQIRVGLSDRGIELKYPGLQRRSASHSRGCMAIGVAVQLRSDISLEAFELSVTHMKVNILGGLFGDKRSTERWVAGPKISDYTKITTVNGGVHADYWNSRETLIESTHGRVTGTYSLLDVLSVHTTNGAIDINVEPKEVDKDHPKSASLILESRNGNIKAENPTHGDIPPRDYQTRVESSNGGTQGTYILGSSATFTSANGGQNIAILPYDTDAKSLKTQSQNGGTTVKVLPPYTAHGSDKTDLSKLQSSHKTSFGSVKLQYPQEWMGTIDAESSFGSVRVHGKDVEQIAVPLLRKHVVVHKGQGDSRMTVRTTSGSIDVLAGDDV